MSKKVLVIGASENQLRYSNKAILKLNEMNHKIALVIDLEKLWELKFQPNFLLRK